MMNLKAQYRLYWLVVILYPLTAHPQTLSFDYPFLVSCETGYVIPQNDFSIPCVGDWDDDGDPDLLVGVMYDGYVYFYENVSVGILPQFTPGVILEADGAPLSVSYA